MTERTTVLAVACSRCDRAGRYPGAKLETYGHALPIPILLRTLSADCPKRRSISAYDLCGIHCPDLSALFQITPPGIRVGLHDEIFHGGKPVLAGVDAHSTYCYLLAAEPYRDAATWGVHLLNAAEQGLRPAYMIADAGQGLRAGQRVA